MCVCVCVCVCVCIALYTSAREGKGYLTYADGSSYEGDFFHGVRCLFLFIGPESVTHLFLSHREREQEREGKRESMRARASERAKEKARKRERASERASEREIETGYQQRQYPVDISCSARNVIHPIFPISVFYILLV